MASNFVSSGTLAMSPSRKETLVSPVASTRARCLEHRRIDFYSHDRPTWSYLLGQQQGDIARATADVQHPHPACDPGLLKEPPGARIENLGLDLESPRFCRRTA
jgi:hypothetical protein